MTGNEVACPGCGSGIRIQERSSRKAGKLIYECRACDRRWSLNPEEAALVEEPGPDESSQRTQRLPAMRPPRRVLTEMKAPSVEAELPAGLSIALEVSDGPARGRTVRVVHSRCVLGRDEGDVHLDDRLVSRRHAVIEVLDSDTILLKDLTSTNGTYHNGRLIDHCKLKDGDEIRLGSTILNVVIESPAIPGD